MNNQSKNFKRCIKNIRKYHTEIIELKNTIANLEKKLDEGKKKSVP